MYEKQSGRRTIGDLVDDYISASRFRVHAVFPGPDSVNFADLRFLSGFGIA